MPTEPQITERPLTAAQAPTCAAPCPSARCERSGRCIPLSRGRIVADIVTGDWLFVSPDAVEDLYDYQLPLAGVTASQLALADCLAQLQHKPWFKADKLMQLFKRLAQAGAPPGAA